MIDLRNAINRKDIPENENQKKRKKKIVDIVKKILDFNKQQNGKGYYLYREKEVTKMYITIY